MEFQSLNAIVNDLLLIIRGSKISQSENISRRQIEAWVNQYRSILLKQDLDKGKMPNPDYIQTIDNIELENVDLGNDDNIRTDFFVLRSKHKLPKTIDLNHKPGIMFIGTLFGDQVQLVPESRVNWQKYRKFSGKEPLAYIKDQYLYIHNHRILKYISMRGIFEIPMEVINFAAAINGTRLTGIDVKYPLPQHMVSILKDMILTKELNIIHTRPSDNKTDSQMKVSPNSEVPIQPHE